LIAKPVRESHLCLSGTGWSSAVCSANEKAEKKNKVEDAASKKVSATRQEMRRQWSDLQKQIHESGKMHKLKRIALAQLPVHPQSIDAGTTFNADSDHLLVLLQCSIANSLVSTGRYDSLLYAGHDEKSEFPALLVPSADRIQGDIDEAHDRNGDEHVRPQFESTSQSGY
jgi:hypothetical protein